MNKLFEERAKLYFKQDSKKYFDLLKKPCSQGFFLNTNKANKKQIFDIVDFDYKESELTEYSYYHNHDNIGKTKAFELGLIYPQEIAASISSKYIDTSKIKTIVDLCAAPGGKSINVLNKLGSDVLMISNDYNHARAQILSQNLERLGLDNVIITNKKCEVLANQLENFADLVILDAPCSGEGMIRKYPEILVDYSLNNIENLSKLQSELLENAYSILKANGQLLYSTCTYAFEEDENQILNFLAKHKDMHLVEIGNKHSSTLKGTIKLSPLDNTEGQFICLIVKDSNNNSNNFKYLKPIKEKLVDEFIQNNLNIDKYYLYKNNEHYYLSFIPLIDLKSNVMKYGIYIGDIVNKRFEPTHNMYRSNLLKDKYKYVYDLNDEEYEKYIEGNELKANLDNNYYLVTYHNYSLGYGKCSNKQLKNKYPKGLRRK